MIRRRLLFLIPALVLALGACAWYWSLHTEPGARWIWARTQAATGGALQAQELQGDLASGLTIRQLAFSTDSMSLDIVETQFVVDVDLLPLQVKVSNAVITDTTIRLSTAQDKSKSADLRALIENLSLPFAIVFADISADTVILSGLTPENDVVLTRAALAARWHDEIIIEHLAVSALDSSAKLSATLNLGRPYPVSVSARVTSAPALTGYPEPIEVRLNAAGSLEDFSINASSTPIEVSLQGSITNMLDTLSWDLQGQLVELNLQPGNNDIEVQISDGRAASSGTLAEYALTAAALIETYDIEPFQSSVTGTGSTSSFNFSELSLHNSDADLNGSGQIDWGENWSIESQMNIVTFNLSTLLEDWPDAHPIHGHLSLQLNEDYLAVSDSFLAAGDTDMSVQIDAEVDLTASVVTGDLRWENATWPIAASVPAVSSESGDITVDGSPDDWRIVGRVEVGTPAIPSGQFRIDGRGDRHHVEATIVESEVLGGVVSGRTAFNWRDQREWSAGLDTSNVDIGSFVDGWPGHVSGRIDASGQMSPFALDLMLSNINGALRGEPLSANGGLSLADNRVRATELKILHGDTRVALDGDLLARSGLTVDVSVNDISVYLNQADGAFAAAGSMSLHPDLPFLHVNATSAAFGFGDIRATGIEIVDRPDHSGVIDAVIKAELLNVYGNAIDNVTIGLVVDATTQSLQFDATHSDTDIHFLVAGEFDDFKNPNSWRGELQELSLAMAGEFAAEMSAPTTLSLSKNAITIDRSCLAATDGMSLCAQADWSADNYLQIGADLADVPLNLVNSFVDTKFEFDQLLNGNFEWQRNKISGTKGNAEMTMTAGRFVSIDNPDVIIDTDKGLLAFDIVNGQLLSGHTTLPLPGLGHIEAQFAVADVTLGKDSGISGLFDIDLADMALLAALSPLIDEAGGELVADLTLSGALSVPQLTGDLAITNGSVTYLPIGLRLDQINITGRLQDDGQIEFSGDFRAGDGRGEIITRSDYQTRISNGFEVELRGNNMTVIDVPDVQAHADVDLRIGYDYKTLTLDGRVFIPHTLIKPSNLTLARDTESKDVVIVAGELPDDPRQSREQPIQMAGSLEVEFGDDVLIDLGRATAKLTGSTVFSWEDSQIPIADGRYDLTGDVRAFGQVLGITEGGLRFPKIPADNPFLRIRAEREIYGNPQVKTAGVLVDGTLKKPTIEAYTNPHTTEERALALLVTGSDFDYEQGVGAIDFGTYIAPRVFVSYGVGLFETENVIRVRYDIKRGFGITATSGQKETGVDLSYRIER